MKAAFANFFTCLARWIRHRAALVAMGFALAGVVGFTLVLSIFMDIGFRREPEAIVEQAIQLAESCQELGEIRQAVQVLDKLRSQDMLPPTRARLLVTLGDLHLRSFEQDPASVSAAGDLEIAARHYREARLLHADEETLRETLAALARVEFLRGDWSTARNTLERLLREDMLPDRRAMLELLKCRALIEQEKSGDAYVILEDVMTRYSAGEVHDQAKIMAAGLLIAECRRRREAAPEAPAPEYDANPFAAWSPGEMARKARTMLETMLERLPETDLRRMRVLNDLLEICLLSDDVDMAYGHVRELERLTGHRDQQIRSFDLLATIEERQGNLADAEHALRFCISQFPEHENSHRMRLRLYRMLLRQGRLEEALETFAHLARHADSRVWGERLTEEMLPENPAAIYHGAPDGAERTRALDILRRLAATMHERIPPRWLLVRERLYYLHAALAEQAGDHEAVEAKVAAYLADSPMGDHTGEILRMDAFCAEALSRSPAVRATRAHRYLSHFPEGPYGEDMLGIILRAYYEMGLHRANLAVAEAAFVHAMMQDADQPGQALRVPVVQTMRWIAQGNSRLGRFDVANTLFNRCARRLDTLEPDAAFFQDWAGTALALGQAREAIRRCEVGMQRLAAPDHDLVMDRMLEIRYTARGAEAIPAIEGRAEALRRNGGVFAEDRYAALHELLFDHVLAYETERMPALLARARSEAPQAIWPLVWGMRYMQHALRVGDWRTCRRELARLNADGENQPEPADRPAHFATCLHYLDQLAELETRIGELQGRGL